MKAAILVMLLVAGCGPSTADMTRTADLFRKVDHHREMVAITKSGCDPARQARLADETATLRQVSGDPQKLFAEMERIHKSIPLCRDYDASRKDLLGAEADLKLWCDSHLNACELHRRREAVVK